MTTEILAPMRDSASAKDGLQGTAPYKRGGWGLDNLSCAYSLQPLRGLLLRAAPLLREHPKSETPELVCYLMVKEPIVNSETSRTVGPALCDAYFLEGTR